MKTRFASLVATILCLLLWSPVARAQVLSPEAQRHFDAGLAYVDDPTGSKWEDALKEFRAAYAASPTWKLMNNIGLSALNLERDGEAIEAYRAYLAHGGEDDFTPKQRNQMEKDIAMLSASLVRVTLDFQPPEAMLIDERRNAKGAVLVNQYTVIGGTASLGIHPGLHKLTLVAPGYTSTDWLFNAEPSSTHQHRFKLAREGKPTANADVSEPPNTAEHRTPTAVYFGLTATVVFAAAATVTGVVTAGKAKDFDAETDPTKRHDIASSGKTFSWLTNIGVGAALVSAGATAYFYFTATKERPAQAAQRSSSRLRKSTRTANRELQLSPVATPSAAGLAISGSF